MSHTYAQNAVHVVFSTKDRQKLINPEFRQELWAYLAGICKKIGVHLYCVGGTEDHVHLLLQIPPVMALSDAIAKIKANSSRWAGEKRPQFLWQQGYGAFSVSASALPAVVKYIANQEEHHKKMDFEAEFVAVLKKHGIAYDPKYVFG